MQFSVDMQNMCRLGHVPIKVQPQNRRKSFNKGGKQLMLTVIRRYCYPDMSQRTAARKDLRLEIDE